MIELLTVTPDGRPDLRVQRAAARSVHSGPLPIKHFWTDWPEQLGAIRAFWPVELWSAPRWLYLLPGTASAVVPLEGWVLFNDTREAYRVDLQRQRLHLAFWNCLAVPQRWWNTAGRGGPVEKAAQLIRTPGGLVGRMGTVLTFVIDDPALLPAYHALTVHSYTTAQLTTHWERLRREIDAADWPTGRWQLVGVDGAIAEEIDIPAEVFSDDESTESRA